MNNQVKRVDVSDTVKSLSKTRVQTGNPAPVGKDFDTTHKSSVSGSPDRLSLTLAGSYSLTSGSDHQA